MKATDRVNCEIVLGGTSRRCNKSQTSTRTTCTAMASVIFMDLRNDRFASTHAQMEFPGPTGGPKCRSTPSISSEPRCLAIIMVQQTAQPAARPMVIVVHPPPIHNIFHPRSFSEQPRHGTTMTDEASVITSKKRSGKDCRKP